MNDYRLWALGSAVFAGMTAVLAKKGVEGIPSNLALAIRVVVILIFAWAIVLCTREASLAKVSRAGYAFLILSGLATGASWLCYFRALQLGPVSKVAPIDKLSFALAVTFGFVLLGEKPDVKVILGCLIIVAGVIVTLL